MSQHTQHLAGDLGPAPTVPELIAVLNSSDGRERLKARLQLILMGDSAAGALADALRSDDNQLRWEAAKALIEVPSNRATPALVAALEDEDSDVRWLAAEALVARQRHGAIAVLEALIDSSDSVWVREGAHHVLHDLAKGQLATRLRPVLQALEEFPPDWSVIIPSTAAAALRKLQNGGDATA